MTKAENNFNDDNKKCWELFSIPSVNILKYSEDNIVTELEFYCKKSGLAFRVGYPQNCEVTSESLSDVINRGLSICHQCIDKKMNVDRKDI